MKDLFEKEQTIYDEAVSYIEDFKQDAPFDMEKYADLAKEYGKLLKQLRRFTKLSDRTAVNLNASKLDLQDKIHYDALTGIFNRRFMEEKMCDLMDSIAEDDQKQISLLMIDIDFFKRYNDTYGHQQGDNCLKNIASALHEIVSKTDGFVARYGGEEFIVVLPDMDETEAQTIAEKLLTNVRTYNIPHIKNEAAEYVTISIGGTTGIVKKCENIADYIKLADQALYKSKQDGRNRYTSNMKDTCR